MCGDDRLAVGDRERGEFDVCGDGDDLSRDQRRNVPAECDLVLVDGPDRWCEGARSDQRNDHRRVSQPRWWCRCQCAPFGGSQIQWSVVFTNAAGQQVGTGASPKYTNDDPSNPPSAVAITITEIPVPITATTVFERSDTTGYSSAAGGYTWSSQITDTGTILSKGIQQVTGATVSTLAGVAGVVWEQDNQFYVRGVPVAQNGATISLGAASVEGFARRPFLLLDPFVQRTDEGNHVLLAPDPNTQYYHVRKVSLDPTTGAPTWDPTVSYGTFLLPVSAAALHSSGHVVAIHTDSGRFGWLKPVQTMPRPVVAAYSAGPGTTTGLLNTPIALAVTNAGTVLVLEAGGQTRRVRSQRQPRPVLRDVADPEGAHGTRAPAPRRDAGTVHATAGFIGHLPRCGGRRCRTDLCPVLHGRRGGAE